MPEEFTNGLRKWRPALLILGILLVIVAALFQRWNINHLISDPNPAKSYEEAVERIQTIVTGETNLNPLCQTRFLTHGVQTDRVIVFVHGYTMCPQQFFELGKQFYELGYNVLIVPVPHHGLADRMTDEQGHIKAEEFVAYADDVVDIAQGLGRHVAISGISLGGVISSWAVQNRSDVDLAVIISPAFSFNDIPGWLISPVGNIFMLLPATYDWWNSTLQEDGGPPYAYPRYSKHTLGEIMRLGFAVDAQAKHSAPAGGSILVITNGNDFSVDNEITTQIVQTWRAAGASLKTYEFEASLRIGHDLIDPNDRDGDIELVYPRLIELIDK